MNPIKRREFLSSALAATMTGATIASTLPSHAQSSTAVSGRFKLRYAPHPGTFKASGGEDIIDQIKFAADQGFTAWEDNGLPGRPVELQEKIGVELERQGMRMGVFVAYASFDEPVFTAGNEARQGEVLEGIRAAVEVAKRVNAKCFTVVPGSVDQQSSGGSWNKYGGARLAPGFQMANAIGLLRRCAEILEPHSLVMVLEPLNWQTNHGGVFLRYSDEAYALCKAVDSPSCKILFDIYHQQITEGNLIPNIERAWDEIAYFQSGDNPGRKEPGTGEINYRNVFKFIYEQSRKTGREFVIGMEHGNFQPGKAGELAVIQAYRHADAF